MHLNHVQVWQRVFARTPSPTPFDAQLCSTIITTTTSPGTSRNATNSTLASKSFPSLSFAAWIPNSYPTPTNASPKQLNKYTQTRSIPFRHTVTALGFFFSKLQRFRFDNAYNALPILHVGCHRVMLQIEKCLSSLSLASRAVVAPLKPLLCASRVPSLNAGNSLLLLLLPSTYTLYIRCIVVHSSGYSVYV